MKRLKNKHSESVREKEREISIFADAVICQILKWTMSPRLCVDRTSIIVFTILRVASCRSSKNASNTKVNESCGFVCAYHPAAPGLNPKQTHICFFQCILLNIVEIETVIVMWMRIEQK